ncbi:hypothetical protein KPL78_07375 [Roseomonas sp. HJA6]|uniref:HD domain-containing protein n=1 Tax=Roseomonas alba TaxID=2846776 RepID=A0ABS7A649_9PROT|nr:hypothetical protein [Neoroseomonas alba]MBW6397658.1 hypothetical protein [Neoroseomonas alba]
MAASAATGSDFLDLALGGGDPFAALQQAEAYLLRRRAGAPEMVDAVTQALHAATGSSGAPPCAARAGAAVAAAVEAHGAGFPPGEEPAYHGRHHQAEATIAMGWLAGAARRLGLLTPEEAALGVVAMAGHDLLHDGRVYADRGVLEERSAEAVAALAAAEGLDEARIRTLRRVILATTWPWEDDEASDLLCHLAREADLFGSSLPTLGPLLSQKLAHEFAVCGLVGAEGVASHAARVGLMRMMGPATLPAQALGLDALRATQLAAYAGVARRLGLKEASAEAGAVALDSMDPADAEALLAWAGTAK